MSTITWPADAYTLCADGIGLRAHLSPADQEKVDRAYDQLALSIAAYESSDQVNQFSSTFDLSRRGRAKLTQQERQGFALFMGKGQCSNCHTATGQKALFTDLATRPDYASYAEANLGKHKVPTLRNVAKGDDSIVKAYGHNGYFKTLYGIVHFYNTRDVLPTCPGDLTEAQALAANCWPAPEGVQNVNTDELGDLGLSLDEEQALVAFLRTLSDGQTG